MTAFFRSQWDKIKTSLWILPSLIALLGPLLAWLTLYLDRDVLKDFVWQNPLLQTTQSGVQSLFSMLPGSLITAGSVLFSITILVLTVVSRQFGSHILRTFRLRSFPKITVGVFIGTYLYSVFVVAAVAGDRSAGWQPTLTMSVGIILVMLTFALFILLLHHLSYQLQAHQIVANIASELRSHVLALAEREQGSKKTDKPLDFLAHEKIQCELIAEQAGYIRAIDYQGLLEFARKEDCSIRVPNRQGQFVMKRSTLLTLYGLERVHPKDQKTLRNCFSIGMERIPLEDIEFNLNQLVEITLIALSPGFNHLYVAITCVDYICDAIASLMTRKLQKIALYDEEGNPRVAINSFSFESFVNAALDPIRQNGTAQPLLAIHLLDKLKELIPLSTTKTKQDLLIRHAYAIYTETASKTASKLDLESLDQRKNEISALAILYQSLQINS